MSTKIRRFTLNLNSLSSSKITTFPQYIRDKEERAKGHQTRPRYAYQRDKKEASNCARLNGIDRGGNGGWESPMEERFGGKGDRSRSRRRRLGAKERSLLKNNAVLFAIGGVRRTNLRLRREMPRWPLTVPACRNTLTCIPAQSVRVLADPASAPAPAFAPRLASPRLFPPRRAPPRPDLARPPSPPLARPRSISPRLASLRCNRGNGPQMHTLRVQLTFLHREN